MNIKITDIVDKENTFLSHMVLNSVNNEALNTLPKDRTDDTEFDLTLTFNGVEIDITKFLKLLEESFDSAVRTEAKNQQTSELNKFINNYKSKNSNNAKLSKIQEQLDKTFNMLNNINENVKLIK